MESFNARDLPPEEVARTFVPPPKFSDVLAGTSSLIVGPRGSGKTTLLKMLQIEALESWEHSDAEFLLKEVNYPTVFVATDRRWSNQLSSLGRYGLDDDNASLLAMAAYTTQVLRALVNTMIARTRSVSGDEVRTICRTEMTQTAEAELVRFLAETWQLTPRLASLVSLRQALTSRLVRIRNIAILSSSLRSGEEQFCNEEVSMLSLPFLDAVVMGIEVFNDTVGQPHQRWALAFDELEIAPPNVYSELVDAVRACDDRVLLKLALSPAKQSGPNLETAFAPAPGNDFSLVRLWHPDRVDGESFCYALWNSMVGAKGFAGLKPEVALGVSYFEPEPGPNGDDYEPGSKWANLFKKMRDHDSSFDSYLTRKRIDPDAMHVLRDQVRAADVRKIAPLLPLRMHYRPKDGERIRVQRVRSRKSGKLYCGAKMLFALTEANPRWFKNLFGTMVGSVSNNKVALNIQRRAVDETSRRFAALLKTAPAPVFQFRGSPQGVLGVIRRISKFISDEHIVQPFKAEPAATFTVPSNAANELLEILEEAVNWGGIVYVPDSDDQIILSSLKGKRFRISYLLAPIYGLPVRLGKPASLGTVFSRRGCQLSASDSETEQEEFDLSGEENEIG